MIECLLRVCARFNRRFHYMQGNSRPYVLFGAMAVALTFLAGCAAKPDGSLVVAQYEYAGVLRIGVYEDIESFGTTTQDGQPTGLEADLANMLGGRIMKDARKVELVAVNSVTKRYALNEGDIDMTIAMQTPANYLSSGYAFSEPYYEDTYAFLTPDGGSLVQQAGQLAGKKLGVISGSVAQGVLQTCIEEAAVECEVVPVASYPEAEELLHEGMIDHFFAESGVLNGLAPEGAAIGPYTYGQAPYCVMVLKENEDVLQLVNEELQALRDSGDLHALIAQYGLD
jgi:ABC-type amino acid transport substrate-binding protein